MGEKITPHRWTLNFTREPRTYAETYGRSNIYPLDIRIKKYVLMYLCQKIKESKNQQLYCYKNMCFPFLGVGVSNSPYRTIWQQVNDWHPCCGVSVDKSIWQRLYHITNGACHQFYWSLSINLTEPFIWEIGQRDFAQLLKRILLTPLNGGISS